ncbi:unnamed protein product [Closterium sp. Naga37s-1]|nr:unnamed protein product [Closterium sp. Naga37s-1]
MLAWCFQTASARFVVESHSLMINSPDKIRGEYLSAIANFGIPQYGGSLQGTVVYPAKSNDMCKPYKGNDLATKAGGMPNIVIVDRGGCYFTDKVFNAQEAGASAVIVADDKDENLLTMDTPEDDPDAARMVDKITIPSALVQKSTADLIKKGLKSGPVMVSLDWREALPHPDERVEYEFWTNSNDECGPKCDSQAEFLDAFKGYAVMLEQGGYTLFTPHYITWYCPEAYLESRQCKTQCINSGRYCAPDPEEDFDVGYDGKDVVAENLRQLCVHRVANETHGSWLWWDYVTDFKKRCRMADKTYGPECAESIITALGLDVAKVRKCMGDPTKDQDNPVLKSEQEAQIGTGDRGDVTILPTVIINNKQYRGKLDSKAVLKAVCSGFKETTDPPVCLGADVQTNDCLSNNGGCWQGYNLTACKDTFRGRVCECPKDPQTGVYLSGDGYTKCEPTGVGRCLVNNGGCWQGAGDGQTFTACQDSSSTQCVCPPGFRGDGFKCEDIDECSEHSACSCVDCHCKNTFGSYECSCYNGLVYLKDSDTCISKEGGTPPTRLWGMVAGIVLGSLVVVAIVAYVVYKYRLRSYMDSEIRAIMAQYMPLDSQNDQQVARQPMLNNDDEFSA